MNKEDYWEENEVTWGIKYDDKKVSIEAKSYKCKDIKYRETHISKSYPYSEDDIKQFLKIRDDLADRVLEESKGRISDAEQSLVDFIKYNSDIWDLNDTKDFIVAHKKKLLKLISNL